MSNGLDVALMSDPHGEWSPENGDCHLDIEFSYPEWGSFFLDTLGAANTRYVDGEPLAQFEARRQSEFRASLPDCPLLARIDEFYKDACFTSREVHSLREELSRVSQLSLDEKAKAFFNGMLAACDSAETRKMGIRLLSS